MVSIAILAGGQSKRMGKNKALLNVDGKTVLERIITTTAPLTDDLFLSTHTPDIYAPFGLRCVPDIYPHKAALGGIYSAISAACHPHVLIVACDMPFLNRNLLAHLISLAPTADIITPAIRPTQPETTHTIYNQGCLPIIKQYLMRNRLRIRNIFEKVSVRYLSRAEIAPFDPNFESCINLNTPQDWLQAQAIIAKDSP